MEATATAAVQALGASFGAGAPRGMGLDRLREEAWAAFERQGVPTGRAEAWRGTDVAPLAEKSFGDAPARPLTDAERERLERALPRLAGPRVVFVDGHLDPALSRADGVPGLGLTTLSRAFAAATPPPALRSLGLIASFAEHPFAALNLARFADGALVLVEPGAALHLPVHLVFATRAQGSPVAVFPRVLVDVGEGAQAVVVETHVGLGEGEVLSCPVTELSLHANARLDHLLLQGQGRGTWHLGRVQARLERDARLTSLSLAVGGRLSRADLGVLLSGEGGLANLDGLYLGGDAQLHDHHTFVDHAAPHCRSLQLYKGVLGGTGRAVFHGRVRVREAAQKTDARQSNRNLLLSREAQVSTKPQLEIRADDVKCTHGAAIGRLDPEALFYLRSRGLGEQEAKGILTGAFANEVLDRVESGALRKALQGWLPLRLPLAEEAP